MDKSLRNILILSLTFLLYVGATTTMSNLLATITDSIKKDEPSYSGEAYYFQSMGYASFALFNWLAPSVINVVGLKISMATGNLIYAIFLLQFLIPKTYGMYVSSIFLGFAGAILWTSQGNYLTLNSTANTITRNSGIFYTISNLGVLIGNIYVMFLFNGKDQIDKSTRLYLVLTFAGIIGIAFVALLFLPNRRVSEDDKIQQTKADGPVRALYGAVKLFFTPTMLLLSSSFMYQGLEQGFYSGVYSSCLGFTEKFDNRKELVGISGLLTGVGGLLCGGIFIVFGDKIVKLGRNYVIGVGCCLHILAFGLIFLNLPNDSTFGDTNSDTIINSNVYLALFCSVLLGMGDSIYNNTVTSLLGTMYADDSAPAFAILQFCLAIGSITTFVTSQLLGIYYQLVILTALALIGTVSFIRVEVTYQRENPLILTNKNISF